MRLSLFWKLGLTALAVMVAGLLAADVYLARALREDYVRAGFQNLESLARMATARPPDVADLAATRDWAAWIAKSGVRVTVIASDGRVLADSEENPERMENHGGRPEIREAFAKGQGQSVRYSNTVQRDLLYWAVKHPSAEPVAVLRFASKLAEVDASMAQLRRRTLLAAGIALVVGGVVSLMLFRSQAQRVNRLKEFSARVAQGDFHPIVVEREGDELTGLAHTLNDTAARLDGTIKTLTAERNRAGAILRSMVEGVAVIGRDGRIIFLNDAMSGILGAGPVKLEGRAMVEVIRQSDLLAVVQRVLSVPHGSASHTASEVTIHPTGASSPRSYVAVAAPVFGDPTGGAGVQGCVLVLHDITDLRRLERVRRDFVANISHEFKTPLTAIQGFAETLLGGALDDKENRGRFLEIIREHAARLGRLTDDLLKLSAIESGRMELNFTRVNVADVVEGCVETARYAAGRKKIELGVESAADLPAIHADFERLSEAVQNLVDNAVQYTPEGGRVDVKAAPASGNPTQIAISVTDTGIGIPSEHQHRIFERFYRVDAARSREAGGTGLGLAIARHIVEAHGGRIEVKSEVGRGSTFSILLTVRR